MIAYLDKYNKLPRELRDKMSDKAAVEAIDALEKKYDIGLAKIVIEIMIKELRFDALAKTLADMGLTGVQAEELSGVLREKVFCGVLDYLGVNAEEIILKKPLEEAAGEKPRQPSRPPVNSLEKIDKATAEKLSKSANFFFSPDDEREIREISNKIADGDSQKDDGRIEEKTEKVVELARINFGSASMLDRFKQIIRTYLKGIRDRISTKQTLLKSFDSGGLSFDEESADKILRLADEIKNDFSAVQDKALKKEPQKAVLRDYDYDLSKELKNRNVKSLLEKIDIDHEIAPPHPILSGSAAVPAPSLPLARVEKKSAGFIAAAQPPENKMPQNSIFKDKAEQGTGSETKEEIKKLKESGNKAAAAPAQNEKSGKIKMEDVKFVPKAFGPVEELKYMDLASFRRLGNSPEAIAKKIKEKISLLEDDSYAKRLEGIKAWRNSPVNKIYLEMGNESIGGRKPISAIIQERSAGGKEFLSDEEISVIVDLNKELRF